MNYTKLKNIIKEYLEDTNPNELFKTIFNIMDKELDKNEIKHVVYNGAFGGYGYSEEFIKYMEDNRYNDIINISQYRYDKREYVYKYIKKFALFLNITNEQALKRASGKYAKLYVKEVPKHRKYKIEEYDGNEAVIILNDFV
jgi:hypothetical protein